jgi:hypothetical protein
MSDNKQGHYTIHNALWRLYGEPTGNRARHLNLPHP